MKKLYTKFGALRCHHHWDPFVHTCRQTDGHGHQLLSLVKIIIKLGVPS